MTTLILLLALAARPPEEGPRTAPAAPAPQARAIDEEPPAAPPFPLSANALCARGDHDLDDGAREALLRARKLFELATKHYLDAACGHAGLSRALVALYLRRVEEDDALIGRALEEAEHATRLDPGSATARAAQASALLADLRAQEAGPAAEAALALVPDSVPALQTAAMVRMARGQLDGARAAIRRALELRPDLPGSHHTLGNVQLLLGEEWEAVESYRSALTLSPGFLPSALQIAAAYEALGSFSTAGAIFRELLQEHPEEKPRIMLYMAHSLMKRGKWKEALGAFDAIDFKTRKGLSNGTVLYLKGICHEQLGRAEEARAAFREVIDKWPNATGGFASPERLVYPAYEGLGRLYLQARDTEGAASVMEEGTSRPDASLDLFIRLARLYQDYRLPDKASALLEKAVARDLSPKNAGNHMAAYVLWARIAREIGDQAALDRLARSLDSQSGRLAELNDYVLDLEAVRALSIAGLGDKALEILRRAVQAGYTHLDWISTDPELESLRKASGFQELLRSKSARIRPND